MKWIKVAIGTVVAISVIPAITTTVNSLTGIGGLLESTVTGTLLDLAPLIFVASILGYLFLKTGPKD